MNSSLQVGNFSKMATKEDFGMLSPVEIGITVGLYSVIEIIGNSLLFGVVYYEKYGGDPQKRTLVNRLISQICLVWIYHNLSSLHFLLIFAIKGHIGE